MRNLRASSGLVWMLLSALTVTACGDDDTGTGDDPAAGAAGEDGKAGNSGKAGNQGASGESGEGGSESEAGADAGGSAGKGGSGSAGKAGGGAGGTISIGGTGSGGSAGSSGSAGSAGSGGSAGTAGSAGAGGTAGSAGAGGTAGAGAGGTAGSAGAGGTAGAGAGGTAGSAGAGGAAGSGGSGGSGGGPGDTWPIGCASGTWCKLNGAPVKSAVSAVDPVNDSVWTAAAFEGQLAVGSSTFTAAAGGSIALIHYDSFGKVLGAFQTANADTVGESRPVPRSVTVDPEGNVFMVASASTGLTFPTVAAPKGLPYVAGTSAGDASEFENAVLVKLDSMGHYLWGFNFQSHKGSGQSLKLDVSEGRLAVVFGMFRELPLTQVGVSATGAGILPFSLSDSGGNIALLSFDSDSGAFEWAKAFGGAGEQNPDCVAVDSEGDIVLAGTFETGINFNPANSASALPGAEASYNIFAAKLGGDAGGHAWSKAFDSTPGQDLTTDDLTSCSLNPQRSSFVLAGSFDGEGLNFGSNTVVNPDPFSVYMGFVAKLDLEGQSTYARGFAGLSTGARVSSDISGGYQMAAQTTDPLTVDGAQLTGAFVAKFGAGGTRIASQGLARDAEVVLEAPGGASFLALQKQTTAQDPGSEHQLWRYRP